MSRILPYMSWECPYQALKGTEHRCTRLNLPCKPMQKGCILEEWRRGEGAKKKPPSKAIPRPRANVRG